MRIFFSLLLSAMIAACGMSESAHKAELRKFADALETVDRAGDRGGAIALLDGITAELRKLNDSQDSALQSCRLAAAQLGAGVAAVAEGGRWQARDRFDAAFSTCA